MDDPFDILGLEPTFDLTPQQVAAAHLRVCAQCHPDRARDPLERDAFMRRTAAAGQAKQLLTDPVSRAQAILVRSGASATGDTPLDQAFLMETMELREAIEEALADPDQEGAAAVQAQVAAMRTSCLAELRAACAALVASSGADLTLGVAPRPTGAAAHAGGAAAHPAGAAAPPGGTALVRAVLARLRFLERMASRLAEAR